MIKCRFVFKSGRRCIEYAYQLNVYSQPTPPPVRFRSAPVVVYHSDNINVQSYWSTKRGDVFVWDLLKTSGSRDQNSPTTYL